VCVCVCVKYENILVKYHYMLSVKQLLGVQDSSAHNGKALLDFKNRKFDRNCFIQW